MESYEGSVVVTTEPLTLVETRQRLETLRAWGVDLSLVEANLRRTPTERIGHMLAMLRLVHALRDGYREATQARELPAQAPAHRV